MTEYIEIRGARENNLKDVSLRIPKRKITIFTGVSGSGKSSIVFDTIATEAQRQLYENFSLFVRNFLPRYPQPDADAIENLSMAVIVDQKRLGGGSHSTVGTITDIYTLLRLLFSRVGKPHVGYANAFSFNDPQGMCPECNGLGRKIGVDADDFLDRSKSLNEGAIHVPVLASAGRPACTPQSGFFDNDKKLRDFTTEEMDLLLYGKDRKYKLGDRRQVDQRHLSRRHREVRARSTSAATSRRCPERTQKAVEPYLGLRPCPLCKGARLSQAALSSQDQRPHHRRPGGDGSRRPDPGPAPARGRARSPRRSSTALIERLQHMVDIGLDYLSLDRETDTLSGGESQRVKMVKHLGSSLVDVMYIFDEPSIGLHPRDVHRLNELLAEAARQGQHRDRRRARPGRDQGRRPHRRHGPGAGTAGGEIVYEGSFADLRHADTLTGRFLDRAAADQGDVPRTPAGRLPIRSARVEQPARTSTSTSRRAC